MALGVTGDAGRFLTSAGSRTFLSGVRYVTKILFGRTHEESLFREAERVVDLLFDIRKRVHAHGTEGLLEPGPVIFACNHVGIFDPIYLLYEIYVGTGGRRRCAQVMREDYFKLRWINRRMSQHCKTIPFPRGGVNRANLETFLATFRSHLDHGVILFISGTRSRSGEIMYSFGDKEREGRRQATRKNPGRILKVIFRELKSDVRVIPTTLTYDFGAGEIHIVFGPPVVFHGDDTLHALDEGIQRVVSSIENQVYIGPLHLLPCLLHCPELGEAQREKGLPLAAALAALQRMSEALHRVYGYIQEGLAEDFSGAFEMALEWYRRQGVIRTQGDTLQMASGLNLRQPRPDARLRKALPSLFYWNQVKHIRPLRESLQEAFLSLGWRPQPNNTP